MGAGWQEERRAPAVVQAVKFTDIIAATQPFDVLRPNSASLFVALYRPQLSALFAVAAAAAAAAAAATATASAIGVPGPFPRTEPRSTAHRLK